MPVTPRRKRLPAAHAKDLELVLVFWEDANLGSDDGPPDTVNRAAGSVLNVSAGFLMPGNRRDLVLCIDVSPHENTVRWPYTIPRKLVKEIRRTGITASGNVPTTDEGSSDATKTA